MIGKLSIIRRKVIGKLASYVTADGQSTEMQMNLFLNGMPILHLIPQKKLSSSMAVMVLQTSGLLTSLHMTNGCAVIAENQNHNNNTYLLEHTDSKYENVCSGQISGRRNFIHL